VPIDSSFVSVPELHDESDAMAAKRKTFFIIAVLFLNNYLRESIAGGNWAAKLLILWEFIINGGIMTAKTQRRIQHSTFKIQHSK
jgi:hypothetical protein